MTQPARRKGGLVLFTAKTALPHPAPFWEIIFWSEVRQSLNYFILSEF